MALEKQGISGGRSRRVPRGLDRSARAEHSGGFVRTSLPRSRPLGTALGPAHACRVELEGVAPLTPEAAGGLQKVWPGRDLGKQGPE